MKNLFAQIESELAHPDHQDGWCKLEKANALAAAIVSIQPNLIVEVGVWAGRSLIPMALSLKYLGKGKILGIDPWRAADSEIGQRLIRTLTTALPLKQGGGKASVDS